MKWTLKSDFRREVRSTCNDVDMVLEGENFDGLVFQFSFKILCSLGNIVTHFKECLSNVIFSMHDFYISKNV
jgi:hypothetical protein